MKLGSLFAGIGGFELAATWAGITPVWSNEIDPFCCKVLRKNFKHRIIEDDIRNIGAHNLEPVDILTGGFPCQPYSIAGQRKGTEDDRHLWPEMLRVIGEVQPRWIIGENVSGLLNWSGGLVLQQIKTDLENKGFSMFPPAILPACGKNAPHKRDRLWIIAYSKKGISDNENRNEGSFSQAIQEERFNELGTFTNPNEKRLQGSQINGSTDRSWEDREKQSGRLFLSNWQDFPTQSPICGGDDGVPNRVDRIASLGNAIVPQIAYEIFKAIIQVNHEIHSPKIQ